MIKNKKKIEINIKIKRNKGNFDRFSLISVNVIKIVLMIIDFSRLSKLRCLKP